MASAEILRAGRARIADPEHWAVGSTACDELGYMVAARSSHAVRWCGFGALRAVCPGSSEAELSALEASALELFSLNIVDVNDGIGHAAVLQVYDHAIAKAEAGL